MSKRTKEDERSESQARIQFESIAEMVKAMLAADEGDDEDLRESTRQAIQDDPLSVQVRTGWYDPGTTSEPAEYMILLCTGGPAVRIVGDLNEHMEAETARIEHQDWGTPWTEYRLASEQEQIVLTYANSFYFSA